MKRKRSTDPRQSQRRPSGWILAAAAAVTLAIAGIAGTAAAGPDEDKRQAAEQQPIDTSGFVDGATYIVTLAEQPASTYDGGVSGIPATAPDKGEQLNVSSEAVSEYSQHLKEHHNETAAVIGAEPSDSYTLAVNAFSIELSAKQAKKLAVQKNVTGVEKGKLHHIQRSTTDFLGLGSNGDGSGGVWQSVGGTGEAGQGVVVGIIDTGIAPGHPSFAGGELGTDASSEVPYRQDGNIVYHKADGGTFTGSCQTGSQFSPDDCNTKLITARYFVDGFGAANIGTPETDGEYGSPRDGDGHGSHTAGIAAGNSGVEAGSDEMDMGTISGVAPAAKIAAYKACWTGNDVGSTDDSGCATADVLSAVEAATADGVDVINFSIGGGTAERGVSAIERAFLGAANAGIFVSSSAGSAGPGASPLDVGTPWITTVGNSTYDVPQSTLVLGDGTELTGASVSVTDEGLEDAPLILAEEAARDDDVEAQLCAPGSLDPAKVSGRIVVCDQGGVAPLDKGAEVADAGGTGMVLVNTEEDAAGLRALEYSVPTVHLQANQRETVREYAQGDEPSASMIRDAVNPVDIPVPQIASSTEEPGQADESDALTPDVTAPGTGVLAAGANAPDEDPVQELMSGTSMASAHVAGLAALYAGEHPNAGPAQIKSALMTTAHNLVDDDGDPVTNVLTQGAGQVTPDHFLDPGMYFPADSTDWASYMKSRGHDVQADVAPAEAGELNQPSITLDGMVSPRTVSRTVVSTGKGTYTPDVKMDGFDVSVSPSTLKFDKAGQKKTFDVTFKRTTASTEEPSDGYLTWTSKSGGTVRMPLAVAPASMNAPDAVKGKGAGGSTKMTVTPALDDDIAINAMGLVKGNVFTSGQGRFVEGFLGQPAGGDPVRSIGHSGSATAGQTISYETQIPRGAHLAKFALDGIEDTADLDLVVVELDADGMPVDLWEATSRASDESILIDDPKATKYLVQTKVHSTSSESGAAEFDLTSFIVPSDATDNELKASPKNFPAQPGNDQQIKLAWEGLDYSSVYMGVVGYGDTPAATQLTIKTGEEPCGGTGKSGGNGAGESASPEDGGDAAADGQLKECKPSKP